MATMIDSQILTQSALDRFYERAPFYDRENRFFAEDFEELKDAGYLTMAVPAELGGRGLSLAEVARQQRNLAYYAPATALAVNMHIYWVGLCADVYRSGDKSVEWILREAENEKIFAAGHEEPGNDIPIFLSTAKAKRVDSGYSFTGRKSFGSLTPVWDYLGVHGMNTEDPNGPMVVHGFMPRGTAGSKTVDTWDTLGMRATRSEDTVLENAFVPDRYVARVLPAGPAGADLFVLGIFSWALIGFANIYYGLARRVLDMTIDNVKGKTSIGLTRPMSYHPEVQHSISEMVMALDAIEPHIEAVAQDWSDGVDYGAQWPSKIMSAKFHSVEGSWRVVDRSLDLVGGFGIFKRSGFERLFRDARLGRIHPGNSAITREIVAKTALESGLMNSPAGARRSPRASG